MFDGLNIKHFYIALLLLIYAVFLIIFHFKIKNDPELKAFFLDSLRENGKPSGKSLTGFYIVQIIGFATIIAIIYSPQHLLPEYFLISLLTFVGGLYGFKVASKYINSGSDASTQSFNQSTTTTANTNNNDLGQVNVNVNSTGNDKKQTTTTNNNSQINNNDDDIG